LFAAQYLNGKEKKKRLSKVDYIPRKSVLASRYRGPQPQEEEEEEEGRGPRRQDFSMTLKFLFLFYFPFDR
jgi:hypothetical protein